MSVYMVAQISVTDPDVYRRYQARFMEVLSRYEGQLLAYDKEPGVEEGSWDHERVVLMSFPDNAAFRRWADSPEYQEIAVDRKAGSTGVVLLVRGLG
ncbi:MAG: DUF1330 domain-containing protein [Stackebrandtia sp.]